ncbi:hypothetical protein OPT61_g329 [Boeremia exigua]|uniref:Uncharacterized protein n=1 Tax=Boeremia exigua TaxID=749465 RepID=A0ACC2IU93_9PLEO|nr:hypothetical protein OPT61_g329 [Boeremia exigua]
MELIPHVPTTPDGKADAIWIFAAVMLLNILSDRTCPTWALDFLPDEESIAALVSSMFDFIFAPGFRDLFSADLLPSVLWLTTDTEACHRTIPQGFPDGFGIYLLTLPKVMPTGTTKYCVYTIALALMSPQSSLRAECVHSPVYSPLRIGAVAMTLTAVVTNLSRIAAPQRTFWPANTRRNHRYSEA